jgi:hypothetical protein
MRRLYSFSFLVRRVCCGLLALAICQMQVFGAFHLWRVSEVYSNSDGSVQFVEMFCELAGQNFVANHQLISRDANGVIKGVCVIPNNVVGNSLNNYLLFGTVGFSAVAGVQPDATLPPDFLSRTSGSVSFETIDTMNYQNLPQDGFSSIHRNPSGVQIVALNSPRNFSRQAGLIRPGPSLSIQRPSTNVVWISFLSAAGRTYAMERTRVLTGAWETVSTIPGDGTLKRYTNTLTLSGDRAFYRLRQN